METETLNFWYQERMCERIFKKRPHKPHQIDSIHLWERPYSCPSDSCRPIHAGLFMPHRFMPGPIHAEHYSCPVGLIHARTYSCPHWFMPCKTKTCISRPFHAWFFSCQVNSCLLKDLFMPGFLMPIPIHASTKPQYCQTTKPNLIRFQGSVLRGHSLT